MSQRSRVLENGYSWCDSENIFFLSRVSSHLTFLGVEETSASLEILEKILVSSDFRKQEIRELQHKREKLKTEIQLLDEQLAESHYSWDGAQNNSHFGIRQQEEVYEKCLGDLVSNFDEAMELEKALFDLEFAMKENTISENQKGKLVQAQEIIKGQILQQLDVNLHQR